MIKKYHLILIIEFLSLPLLLPIMFLLAVLSRLFPKKIDVGLGPSPLINNIYHKKSLQKYGYSAETYVYKTYFITQQFDILFGNYFKGIFKILIPYFMFLFTLIRYKILYIYFNGGPLGISHVYQYFEPILYKIAGIKIVVMPYGGDVHDLTRTDNLKFKYGMCMDYPKFKNNRSVIIKKVDKWTKHADHVISGCDWVYFMYHWDSLTLGHFSIDVEQFIPIERKAGQTIKILHAPNHKNIKGSNKFIEVIEELKQEGYDLDLILVQKQPNEVIKKLMTEADIIADQLVIGWYAMTALEAMCFEKPVLCYLDSKLIDLYCAANILESSQDIPIVNCDFDNLKIKLKFLIENEEERLKIGKKGREYVKKYHSLEKIGGLFAQINQTLLAKSGNKNS
jgi:glycosyltransferase involved in cell wall biosynthesis